MKISKKRSGLCATKLTVWVTAAAILLTPLSTFAQATQIKSPGNKYSLAQDVQLGRQAATEVERQLPLLPENGETDDYVETVGRRLVAALPSEFQHAGFDYEFDVVNARDINAFALPGGPMYVNRGMIEAARTEGEMAGVIAHEIAHVALRHGTAQATKAQSLKFQLPAIGGAILGGIVGGNLGGLIVQGTQFGLGTYFLKYSRDYERQADILGAQIMARAGYDPRDLAQMFRTIERQSRGGGPEWLSSHPDPDDRYERINEEAQRLGAPPTQAGRESLAFDRVRAGLRNMSPAPTMEQIARSRSSYPSDSRTEGRVEHPSSGYKIFTGGDLFRIAVPENWREFPDRDSVTFAPDGAYGNYQGQPVFTHGAIVGVTNTWNRDLRRASEEYINTLLQNNGHLRAQGGYRAGALDGQPALALRLSGRSHVTGRIEAVTVYTTMMWNKELFHIITVAPQDDYAFNDRAFQTMLRSIQING